MIEPQPEFRVLRWDFIETIANNELSKIVGIIPIAGYLILFNDALLQSLGFNDIAGVTKDDVSPFWFTGLAKLRFTFFGSLFVLVANVTFRLRAPPVLGEAKSDIAFSDQVVASYSLSEIVTLENSILGGAWTHRTPLLCKDERFMFSLNKVGPRLAGFRYKNRLISDKEEYIRACAREWWVGQMHTRWWARRVALSTGLLGFALLAIPTIDIAQAVLQDLLYWI
ncbi:hypothetical protein [Ruegeria atlantica]|uniref:hypothetical protein n=1 Tax=Ruegeria atlantica TaxID=81569 RepID=UPI00147C29A4|nr:hypothetical protein [Ruegeria atlantica]